MPVQKKSGNLLNAPRKMFEHITSFQRKLVLFKDRFNNSMLTHFPCLKMQHDEGQDINYQKYSTMIEKLSAVFDAHFLDFRQLELIDLQSDNDMKRAFDENDLVNFYKNYVEGEASESCRPCLENHFTFWKHILLQAIFL